MLIKKYIHNLEMKKEKNKPERGVNDMNEMEIPCNNIEHKFKLYFAIKNEIKLL